MRNTDMMRNAIFPLYLPIIMGFIAARWSPSWLGPGLCRTITHLASCFIIPFFTVEFIIHIDPFETKPHLILADLLSKLIGTVIILTTILKTTLSDVDQDPYGWFITGFSMLSLTNSLVVGVPLLSAMYGEKGKDMVVQLSVMQATVWQPLLLLALEVRKVIITHHDTQLPIHSQDVEAAGASTTATTHVYDRWMKMVVVLWRTMKTVAIKLASNPNFCASVVSFVWALVAYRYHKEMPTIIEDSILIMSKLGSGLGLFTMGMCMAEQRDIVPCGPKLGLYAMALRFIAGPIAMFIGATLAGLHGDILRAAIIQAAIPQSITSFIFAREYELHEDVLITAVIWGMAASIPVVNFYSSILQA